jgi:hypothetical protein
VSGDGSHGTSAYRLSLAHVLRFVGPLVIAVGALWVVVALTGLTGMARGLVALLTLVVILGALVAVIRPPRVLTLTDDAYRISLVRGAGVARAPWRDVEAVGTQSVGGAPSILFTLKGDATSVLPLSLLGARNVDAQREVHQRLNDANGYKLL